MMKKAILVASFGTTHLDTLENNIAAVEKDGAKYLELVPAQGKKNLADAPVLKCLEGM